MKSKLLLFLSSMVLGIGTLAGSIIGLKNTDNLKQAKAATYDCVFDINPSVQTRTVSTSTDLTEGVVTWSQMSTTFNSRATITGAGGKTITVTETEENSNCFAVYVPLRVFIYNLEAYKKLSYNLKVTVNLTGGTSNCCASAAFYAYGEWGKAGNDTKVNTSGEYFGLASSTATAFGTNFERVISFAQTNGNTGASENATVSNLTANNKTASQGNMCCYYGGIFMAVRKHGSTTHKVTATVSAQAVSATALSYAFQDSTNTSLCYTNLQDVLDNAASGSTLNMVGNSTDIARVDVDKNLTINMNNHKILFNSDARLVVKSGSTLYLTGTGSVEHNMPSGTYGLVTNEGTLSVGANVSIKNLSTTTLSSKALTSSGILDFSGSASSGGVAIIISGGVANIRGSGTITSANTEAIRITNGTTYLYESPTISTTNGTYEIDLFAPSSGNPYLYASKEGTKYSGNAVTVFVELTNYSAVTTIIGGATSDIANKFSFTGNKNTGWEYTFDSSASAFVYKQIVRNVSATLTNCSATFPSTVTYGQHVAVTITANTGYKFTNDSVVISNSSKTFTRGTEYTFDAASGYLYLYGQYFDKDLTITVTAVVQTNADKVQAFISGYMRMSYNATGQCNSYYGPAKEAFNNLSDECRELFLTDATYSAAKERLIAWSIAKGDTLNTTTNKLVAAARVTNLVTDTNSSLVLIIIAISVLGLASLGFILRKKHA